MEANVLACDFKKPVGCPHCHKPLTIVQVQVTKVLEWTADEDGNEEARFEDNGQGSTEVFCHNCGSKIGHYDANTEWGIFPDDAVTDI